MKSLKKLWGSLNHPLPHQKALRLALGIILTTTFVLWMEHYWREWLIVTIYLYMLAKLIESMAMPFMDDPSPEPGPEPMKLAILFALGAPAIAFRLLSGRKLFSNTHYSNLK